MPLLGCLQKASFWLSAFAPPNGWSDIGIDTVNAGQEQRSTTVERNVQYSQLQIAFAAPYHPFQYGIHGSFSFS